MVGSDVEVLRYHVDPGNVSNVDALTAYPIPDIHIPTQNREPIEERIRRTKEALRRRVLPGAPKRGVKARDDHSWRIGLDWDVQPIDRIYIY